MNRRDQITGIIFFLNPILWAALCVVLAFFSNWLYYAAAASGYLLISGTRMGMYFWQKNEGDRNKIGLFSFVMVSLLPLPQLLMLIAELWTHTGAPWMIVFASIPFYGEVACVLLSALFHQKNHIWVAASAACFALMPIAEEIVAYVDPSRGATAKMALIIVAFASVFLLSILMGPLFLMNKGIPLVKKIVNFSQQHRLGFFLAITAAFVMGIMTVIYLVQNGLPEYWSLAIFYFSSVFVRGFSFLGECLAKWKYPNNQAAALRMQYTCAIVCGAVLLTFGQLYGAALTSFVEWDNAGKFFQWYTVMTIIFIGLRSFLSVRSLIDSLKEKSPAHYINYVVDLIELTFSVFSLTCLILKTTGWQYATLTANILWYLTVAGGLYFLIRFFIYGIKGRNAQSKILEQQNLEQEKNRKG